MAGLGCVRVLNRYDMEGVAPEDFEAVCSQVLSEPPVDMLYDSKMPLSAPVLRWSTCPASTISRADSAAQCIQLLNQKERPLIRTAKVYFLEGAGRGSLKRAKETLITR